MDPFVVTSLGRKTYRTRVVRHNLNPVFEEKLVFQVLRHETNYSLTFTVVDRDTLSGNDFVGKATFSMDTVKAAQPEADPDTDLYRLPDPPDGGHSPMSDLRRSKFRLPMSRSSSATNINRSRNSSSTNLAKLSRTTSTQSLQSQLHTQQRSMPRLRKETSGSSFTFNDMQAELPPPPTSNPQGWPGDSNGAPLVQVESASADDPDLRSYVLPLELKNKERWEAKHSPTLYIRAKYLPYQALRQQFWRAMLRQYDADESGFIDKIELTTMLDTLGSTLHNSTIDSFFTRFAHDNNGEDILTMDQAVICLEDQLQKYQARTFGDTIRGKFPSSMSTARTAPAGKETSGLEKLYQSQRGSSIDTPLNNRSEVSFVPSIDVQEYGKEGQEGDHLPTNDLAADDGGEEHVVEISECPICHQPRLNKKNSEADIITHIATCASQDWRAVNNIVMAGFVTSSQAQRKWYSKVITKISYGGYKLGANSANILVQDRLTGQINEERMSVYVRLGIRLLYKGFKSRDMEKKRSKSGSCDKAGESTRLLTLCDSTQASPVPLLQARPQIR